MCLIRWYARAGLGGYRSRGKSPTKTKQNVGHKINQRRLPCESLVHWTVNRVLQEVSAAGRNMSSVRHRSRDGGSSWWRTRKRRAPSYQRGFVLSIISHQQFWIVTDKSGCFCDVNDKVAKRVGVRCGERWSDCTWSWNFCLTASGGEGKCGIGY